MTGKTLLVLTSLGLVLGAARPASACGGTFCDTGPTAMPVDQTGENILFVLDEGMVEAHIQIQYTGEPERFAWVLPLPAIPEVEVGSQLMFASMLAGSVPSYGFNTTGCATSVNGGGGVPVDAGGPPPNGGPEVVLSKIVGAFSVRVLQGGTAQEISDWLSVNGYQDAPTAPAILQDYVEKNHVFAAVKLLGGTGVDEIHPLVVRYPGSEACVPLKLTAVAAAENMGVRTFFLGDNRVVPSNYKHVELNPARLDWNNFAPDYREAVSRAVDSPVANGQAFVTEYAGSSQVVDPSIVHQATWIAAPFVTMAATGVIDELSNQGIMTCDSQACSFAHPMVKPLLDDYLPVPAGVTEVEFYNCVSCYEAQLAPGVWDGQAFAVDYWDRVVNPGLHAQQLLADHPYLTRLFTTISPAEMTLDPTFHERAGLPPVAAQRTVQQRFLPDGRLAFELGERRRLALTDDGSWPSFPDTMPWAERIVEYPASLAVPIDLVDNGSLIDLLVAAQAPTEWNDDPCSQGGNGGGPGVIGGTDGGAGRPPATGSSSTSSDDDGGCAVRPGGSSGFPAALLGLALLPLAWRRRRDP